MAETRFDNAIGGPWSACCLLSPLIAAFFGTPDHVLERKPARAALPEPMCVARTEGDYPKTSITATAGLAGISQSYLSMIERGDRPVTKRALLKGLAQALKVSPAEFVGKQWERGADTMTARAHAGLIGVAAALDATNLASTTVSRCAGGWKLRPMCSERGR